VWAEIQPQFEIDYKAEATVTSIVAKNSNGKTSSLRNSQQILKQSKQNTMGAQIKH
jgi:hypothetical protein